VSTANASTPVYDFFAACESFRTELLEPTEQFSHQQPFLAVYLAAALIDPLASAHRPAKQQGTRTDYKKFVAAYMSDYDPFQNEVYHVIRCGLLHGSRLDIATATPPTGVTVRTVRLSPYPSAPYVENATNELQVGVGHFVASLRTAFNTFAQSQDSDILLHFPQRYHLSITDKTVWVASPKDGVSTLTKPATGG
jgi:hypothetical protein